MLNFWAHMRAENYLHHLNFIRIHISEAPGYGDQTLVAQIVDRIIAMSFLHAN